ncbi:hypothetical protein GWK47_026574 [Chionoecetes opilio]|uniref:Uncharacterized protein n=1 Tax=Chionoecetes opilio TaxID=41210 RepID=A0A8J8WCZ8_CHIOP|nr:hypothetical protein GWK47_026574 [Chionoecetes opilio]
MDIGSMAVSKARPIEHELGGKKPAEKIGTGETQEIPERLVALGGKILPSPLAIRGRIAVVLTGEETPVLFGGSRQAQIRLAKRAAVVLKEGRSGRRGKIIAFFDTRASNRHGARVLALGLSKNSDEAFFGFGLPPSCPRGDPQGCLQSTLWLFLGFP